MNSRAFTLIELLIVVAIIAILAAIAVPNFLEAQVRAKVSRTKSDMRTITTGLEAYRVDSNKYPPMADWNTGENLNYWSINSTHFHSRTPNFLTTPVAYLTSLPIDPFIPVLNPMPTFGRYNSSTRVGLRFVYYNYQQFAEDLASAASARRGEATGGWVFFSFGPDKADNQTETFNGTYLRYDATNGTVSLGNIVRTGSSPEGAVPFNPLITTVPKGPN